MKKIIAIICLCLMLISGALAATSSELTEIKTETATGYRIDYVDEAGYKTLATDKGYATVVRIAEGNTATVFYFDADGDPIALSSGQYGKYGEYNEKGEDVLITYLNAQGEVINLKSGYATTLRTFEDGRMVQEMYLTKDGEPAVLDLGQSGYRRTFDEKGNVASITYLDPDGNTLVTNRGYDTVIKEYDGTRLVTERYYAGGEPVSLKYGQYGVRYGEDGEQTLIDENGQDVFVLSYYLASRLWLCAAACLVLVLTPIWLPRKGCMALFFAYIAFILYMTLARVSNEGMNLELFWSYRLFFQKEQLARQIIENILLFVPAAVLMRAVWPKSHTVLILMLLSCAIEITQVIGGFGLCELDDVVSNTLGALVGYLIGIGTEKLKMHGRLRTAS